MLFIPHSYWKTRGKDGPRGSNGATASESARHPKHLVLALRSREKNMPVIKA